jgi:hypothetical protein
MADNYQILITKLDSFIRKFYKNQIIRGLIYTVTAILLFFLTITFFEYFAWMGTDARTVIFYSFLIISSLVIIKLIIIPISKLFRIGKIISHRQAAQIIGQHFGNVEDKLLNTLQLKELSDNNPAQADLIRASIDQKISGLRPVPFSNAIDLTGNKKYLKFAITPIIVIIAFLLAAPNIITEPTARIINHQTYYEKAAPFQFLLENEKLETIQNDNFFINLKIEGETVPESVNILIDNQTIRMRKKSNVSFTHTLRNLQNDKTFSFEADGFRSDNYKLKVLPRPIILNFETELQYPSYTRKTNEILKNTGDISVPEGSKINWIFYTVDTDEISMRFKDTLIVIKPGEDTEFKFQDQFFSNQSYSIVTSNKYITGADSMQFAINVVPDVYPTINIEEYRDSTASERLFFRGLIKDDYGFKKLSFFYKVSNISQKPFESQKLSIQKELNQQQFFHFFDLNSITLQPGDEIEYYFEVWDNDGINGSKSTRSQKMFYKTQSLEEIQENVEVAKQEIKSNMESVLKDIQLLQQEIDEINRDLFEKQNLNWQDKLQIEDLLNRHKSIQKNIEELQEKNEQKMEDQQKLSEVDEELLQKQMELQKMMEELLTDEMKEMIDEIQKLLDELDKDKLSEMMEEMKMDNKSLEESLDRSLELFKQFEFEQKLQETIDKLQELAKKQDKLSEETSQQQDGDNNEELKEKQEALNEKFDQLRKDMENLEKMNQELENPNQMEDTSEDQEGIEESMEESSENLEQNQNSKASESQKNASQKMEQLSQKMQQMMDSMMMEQMGEDIKTLREILENLIQISFDQEELMEVYNDVSTNDPKYPLSMREQQNIKDNMVVIEDSLKALAKRQIMIKPFVMKELETIYKNIDESISQMENRRKGTALVNQQLSMTSMNNLALLLGESLDQMQQQMMSMQASGQSSCQNPGKPGGSQQMNSMKGLQEQLNKQLQELRDGQQPGAPGKEGQSMSEQLARMAAEQAAIRRMMEQFRDELKEEGRFSDGNISKMIQDMEETEKDIVNNRITRQTLERQQEILTRLLQSEKAERQREEEQRRESQEARDPKISNPEELPEFFKIKSRELELLKTLPPNLRPYYRERVTEYFYKFE